jgi:predicted N-acetyltransferase YhbS
MNIDCHVSASGSHTLTTLQLTRAVTLRAADIDDIASIRYVHEAAFLCHSAEYHTAVETAAFLDMLRRPDYGRELLNSNLMIADIGGEIVGTAGWLAADDRGKSARIRKVFVRPMFGNSGIGRLLVNDAELRAARAGYLDFSVRATLSSTAFYKRMGYRVSSHGVLALQGADLPITYMRKAAKAPSSEYH